MYTTQLTWFSPPHSPAGGFAPKLQLPTTTPLAKNYYALYAAAGLTSKLHRAHSKFLRCLRGSFRLQLASTFNHRPGSH